MEVFSLRVMTYRRRTSGPGWSLRVTTEDLAPVMNEENRGIAYLAALT